MTRRFVIHDLEHEQDQTTTETLFVFERDRPTVPHEYQIEEQEQEAAVGLAAIVGGDSRRGLTKQDQRHGN